MLVGMGYYVLLMALGSPGFWSGAHNLTWYSDMGLAGAEIYLFLPILALAGMAAFRPALSLAACCAMPAAWGSLLIILVRKPWRYPELSLWWIRRDVVPVLGGALLVGWIFWRATAFFRLRRSIKPAGPA